MFKSLTVLLLTATTLTVAQYHNSNDRWIWSPRDPNTVPEAVHSHQQPLQNHNNRHQQLDFAQRRSAAIDSNNKNWFKSISARSFPNSKHPANILDILKEKPKVQKPLKNRGFQGLTGQEKDVPELVTPGLYPYPFGAKPIDLGDGTSIGFAPQDTLPVEAPIKNGHSSGHFNQISEDKVEVKTPDVSSDDRYTTLDVLNSNRAPVRLPDPHTYSDEILGGLHPDEVFYADNNLMIIKGGGFHVPFDGSNDIDDIRRLETRPVHGNSIGDVQLSELPTRVRPTEVFKHVPLPFRFVNGNIPTIVKGKGPINRRDSFQKNSFRPLHHNLGFQPILNNFRPAASNVNLHRVQLSRDNSLDSDHRLQTLENMESDEILMAEPSYSRPTSVQSPYQHVARKRSANPKEVQYHYQTRGNGALPIVNYQVHKNGDLSRGDLQITRFNNNNRNSIPREQKVVPQETNVNTNKNEEEFSELEDLSTSSVSNPLIPTVQTPKLKPVVEVPFTIAPISLRGDTDVNFLAPRPRQNPLAARVKPVTRTIANPSESAKPIDRKRERQPSFFVPLAEPTPRVPQQSARFTQQPSGRVPSITRLRPQQSAVLRPTRRFMEPRRRRPIRQKSLNPRF